MLVGEVHDQIGRGTASSWGRQTRFGRHVCTKGELQVGKFSLMVVDEAHHAKRTLRRAAREDDWQSALRRNDDAGLRKACPKATRARAHRALQFNVPTHNKPWSSFRSSNKGDGLANWQCDAEQKREPPFKTNRSTHHEIDPSLLKRSQTTKTRNQAHNSVSSKSNTPTATNTSSIQTNQHATNTTKQL